MLYGRPISGLAPTGVMESRRGQKVQGNCTFKPIERKRAWSSSLRFSEGAARPSGPLPGPAGRRVGEIGDYYYPPLWNMEPWITLVDLINFNSLMVSKNVSLPLTVNVSCPSMGVDVGGSSASLVPLVIFVLMTVIFVVVGREAFLVVAARRRWYVVPTRGELEDVRAL